jgi:hypothetical protein
MRHRAEGDWPRIGWQDAEPGVVRREQQAMKAAAPDLVWRDEADGSGWYGRVPHWAASRPAPAGLEAFLAGRRLQLRIRYPEAFPMVPPRLYPLDPEPQLIARTQQQWHVEGDGALCLMQAATDWHPRDTAADLIAKASAWFVEFLLLTDGCISQMTERGISVDTSLDSLIAAAA